MSDDAHSEDQDSSTMEELDELIEDDPIEADSSASSFDPFKIFNDHGMIWLGKGNSEHDNIVRGVCGSLGRAMGVDVMDVIGVHKNMHSSFRGQARLGTFRIFAGAVAEKCGGDANVKDAWYGGSKDEICSIIANGFICRNDGLQGIQLSPVDDPLQSVMSAEEDEKGMRHILLCSVILGKMKIVQPGTEQIQPCFEPFDSGFDSLVEPRRYVIWSTYMNSHISPNYVISFKLPGNLMIQTFHQSPYMQIVALMNVLSNYLHPLQMAAIERYHKSFLANNISRDQLAKHIRLIAGDNLLKSVITSINLATSNNKKPHKNQKGT